MISTASTALALPKSQDTDFALIKQCPVIKPRRWIKCIIINPFNIIIDDKKERGETAPVEQLCSQEERTNKYDCRCYKCF